MCPRSVEVPVNAVAGTPLVRIRATDNDTVPYNRQLVYSITASDDTVSRRIPQPFRHGEPAHPTTLALPTR